MKDRYQLVCEKISKAASARLFNRENKPILIAVSKKQSIDRIEDLYRLGHRDFGENYVQELTDKAKELRERGHTDIRWHFIGHLQRNKVKSLLPWVFAIHSLDSERLAREVASQWLKLGRGGELKVFVEVNLDEESNKSGVLPSQAENLVRTIRELEGLRLEGLMCIPAEGQPSQSKFARLREMEARLRPSTHGMLSMGMSGDYESAIGEGATHVRVGTALFGPRE